MRNFSDLTTLEKAAVSTMANSLPIPNPPSLPDLNLGQADTLGRKWSNNYNLSDTQIGSGFSDLYSGLSKDVGDIGTAIRENWARRRKESDYGNFANIGPMIPLALAGLWGGGSLLRRILSRGKKG